MDPLPATPGAASGTFWGSGVAILQVASDLLFAASYLALLAGFLWFLWRRPDLARDHRLLAVLLGCFITLIAAVRMVEAISPWHPLHDAQIWIKAAAALVFAAAVAAVLFLLPGLVRLSSPRQIRETDERLRREVMAHEASLRDLETVRLDLENRVAEQTRDLAAVTARLKTARRRSKVYISSQDRELRYTAISDSMLGLAVEDIIGRTDAEILPAAVRDEIVELKHRAIDSGLPANGEIGITDELTERWYDFHAEPLRDGAGTIIGVTCAAVDITERRQAEAHLRLLLRELTHRSKNLLAIIQAIARQTARHAGSIEAFLDHFGARLQALATSHDLLVQEGWYGVSLGELVRSLLGHYIDRSEPQVFIAGNGVVLKPEVAQSLVLALHELAINAARYGAFSVPEGRVSIRWEVDGQGVEILWVETGGPEVSPPSRRGFGTLVVEGNLPRSVDAEVELSFPAQGVRCRIVIPSSRLLPPAGAQEM